MAKQFDVRGIPSNRDMTLQHAANKVSGVLDVHPKLSFDVARKRDNAEDIQSAKVEPDDIVELELENGIKIWQRADSLEEYAGTDASRGMDGSRSIIPGSIGSSRKERGAFSWAVKAFRVFGVDPVADGAKLAARVVARKIEDQLQQAPGLYSFADDGTLGPLPPKLSSAKRVLVFVHGTASSSTGSFADVISGPNPIIDKLREVYGRNVLAFEHRTMTENPLQNALLLVKKLPKGATVDLVTHSRGGLVAEVLSRSGRVLQQAGDGYFDETDNQIFRKRRAEQDTVLSKSETAKQTKSEIDLLGDLNAAFRAKKIRVDRVVRVACPAGGTTLASGRLDRYFSILLNVMERIPGLAQNPVYDLTAAFLMALVKMRADPSELPGLEAQMPDSPLVACLNRSDVSVDSRLYAITGDVEGSGILKSLAVFVTDIFFLEDHDLVVNTASMTRGTRRSQSVMELADKGPDTNHFSYFKNERTAQGILSAVKVDVNSTDSLTHVGFTNVGGDFVDPPSYGRRGGSAEQQIESHHADRPTVFLLPGITGSHIQNVDNRVWFDPIEISLGGSKKLKIDMPNVTAESPISLYYGSLSEHLENSNNVVEFAFDWRLSLLDEAKRLARAIELALARSSQPVRILAHSMGGLLALVMAATEPAIWKELTRREGGRLLMLGTPCGGSHSIVNFLTGGDKTIKQLALLDFFHSRKELLDLICRFPGVLELLPEDHRRDFFELSTWESFHGADGDNWVLPTQADLSGARHVRRLLNSFEYDRKTMFYIAGRAPATPNDVVIKTLPSGKQKISMLATSRGDGRVPWETGIPEDLDSWLAQVSHGDLSKTKSMFPAISDVLNTGKTNRLPKFSSMALRGAEEVFEYRQDPLESFPTGNDLISSLMGATKVPEPEIPTTQVKVHHGNLAFSPFPVLLGHYKNTPFAGPERHINHCMEGLPLQYYNADIYPGDVGTSLVVTSEKSSPKAAVIVGLGEFGELAPAGLKATLSKAIISFGLDRLAKSKNTGPNEIQSISVSALLVGIRSGQVRLEECVKAILDAAVEARRELGDQIHIDQLRIYELYEDLAIEAAQTVRDFARDQSYAADFRFSQELVNSDGGLISTRFTNTSEWSQRIQIKTTRRQRHNGEVTTGLEFIAHEESSRATEESIAPQRTIVETYLKAAQSGAFEQDKLGQLMYEQFVPYSIKAPITQSKSLILLLDDESATFPWELMVDPYSKEKTPVCCETQMIRQLIGAPNNYRKRTNPGERALVIGDPISDLEELRGAQEEARSVAVILKRANLKTRDLVRENGHSVLTELMIEKNRILHIAGHGIYDHDGSGQSALVLGQDLYLTVDAIKNMSHCPEFVFLNCCHLGANYRNKGTLSEHSSAESRSYSQRADIAASIAAQFIRSGAKAVIAAGWAIDDLGAEVFAKTFYESILNGSSFGEAALDARSATHIEAGATTTFGAYQCYGDPGYQLFSKFHETKKPRLPHFVAPREAVIELHNLCKNAAVTVYYTDEELHKKLAEIKQRIPTAWAERDASVLSALGDAERILNRLGEAIAFYEKALCCESTEVPIRLVEKLANVQAKSSTRMFERSDLNASDNERKTLRKEAVDTVQHSIRILNGLSEMTEPMRRKHGAARIRSTEMGGAKPAFEDYNSDRQSLLGSCYKCLARLSVSKRAIQKALASMAEHYGRGYQAAIVDEDGRATIYAGLNTLYAKALLDANPTAVSVGERTKILNQVRLRMEQSEADNPSFWTGVVPADLYFLDVLTCPRESILSARQSATEAIVSAWNRGGSPRAAWIILDQLSFLQGMVMKMKADGYQDRGRAFDAVASHVDKMLSESG